MDIAMILTKKFSDALWSLSGDDYNGLEWLDDSPKPTKKQLDALWPEVQHEIAMATVQAERRAAYVRDADPLFFGFQRGENSEQDWLDVVQSVKDAYPYPAKSK